MGRLCTMVALAVLLAGAVVSARIRASEPRPPQRCCFDGQWSATRREIGGFFNTQTHKDKFVDGITYMGYDIYSKMEGSVTYFRNSQDNSTYEIHELKDFERNIHYVKRGNESCVEEPLKRGTIYPHCIPEDARLVSPLTFGYGRASLDFNLWEFHVQSPRGGSVLTRLGVTRDFCVPVVQIFEGYFNGTSVDFQVTFNDYRPGVADIQAFNRTAIGC